MTLYVKKRIPVQAMQYSFERSSYWENLYEFTNYLVREGEGGEYFVFDYLHNTWVQFKVGDWIVKGVRGEFYPVEEEVFAETYEKFEGETEENSEGTPHVIPVADRITHIARITCACDPVIDEDGIVIHNAADGRE
jgi:hypothetical protein